ncbi:hypothetical protein J6590_105409, partial [Homalodisca vitripennis]
MDDQKHTRGVCIICTNHHSYQERLSLLVQTVPRSVSIVVVTIGDFRTTTNGRAGGQLERTGSVSGHSTKQQPRSTLLDLVILRQPLYPLHYAIAAEVVITSEFILITYLITDCTNSTRCAAQSFDGTR